jgi:hypothetical protein
MLVAGATAGIILSRGLLNETAPPAGPGDGLAWLRDRPAGVAVQVNPANGRAESRLNVAQPGTSFELAQREGLLVVTTADGRITIIDVATLATSGGYQGVDRTLALLDDEHLFAVDLTAGTISELDPADGHIIAIWTTDVPLAHATLDGNGTLWAIRIDGRLFELAALGGRITDGASAPVTIGAAGPGVTLVGHVEGGVTVLVPGDSAAGADSGIAVRVGTDADGTTTVPGLTGPIVAASRTSVERIPVSKPDTSSVLIIGPGGVIAVDTSAFGCHHPADSAERDGLTYVSCHGAGLIIALDPQGRHTPPDLRFAPGTDPDITVHGGHVYAIAGTTVYVDGQPTDLAGSVVAAAPPKPKPDNPPGNEQPPGGGGQNPPVNPVPGNDPPGNDPPPGDDPPPPPDLPIAGETVIAGITGTYHEYAPPCVIPDPIPPPPWIPDCYAVHWYEYEASLQPPPAWASFGSLGGTCVLRAYVGSTLIREVGHACSDTGVPLGVGTGDTWNVVVHACLAGSCVDSSGYPVTTTRSVTCTIAGCSPS